MITKNIPSLKILSVPGNTTPYITAIINHIRAVENMVPKILINQLNRLKNIHIKIPNNTRADGILNSTTGHAIINKTTALKLPNNDLFLFIFINTLNVILKMCRPAVS